ncbi:DNA methyltransferase [Thiospirillum jenense]|uniref:Methyltransferase n=1 Tax=Thiospirillum jenense TaxID=1653858 RepID=A0A839HBQ6_9GAMM|nr:DNA methyltransferase [Thiospirillum jenense]MBB1124866.1 restriction endonuclease [Thiospirillum jenense]
MMNQLFYGDNLDVLRNKIKDDTVDLCYIDPPFNSKRNYFQIYNNVGKEDAAQAQAFIDTWTWNQFAESGFADILTNQHDYTTQTIELIKGLRAVLGAGGLLAYLISMTQRINEIWRVLKPTGSFYLHCDPTCSHYLKLILDSVFCPRGGDFRNEIVWCYRGGGSPKKDFGKRHDVIFRYSKSNHYAFNSDLVRVPYQAEGVSRKDDAMWGKHKGTDKVYKPHPLGKIPEDWWPINVLNSNDPERLGYPTQKPETLLERIIQASSNEGDLILDAYCGCGTTVAVAQRLNRQWIGIDITYQSIALILERFEKQFGVEITNSIVLNGIPRDMESAHALANKQDDRLRKEFEKWAVLTYTKNRATINDKKGADKGVDGVAYIVTGQKTTDKVIIQVKSGKVQRGDIAKLRGDMVREQAVMALFITLEEPTKPMREEAMVAGIYHHQLLNREYPCIQLVTVQDMIEAGRRSDLPLNLDVLNSASPVNTGQQSDLL